MCMMTFLFVIAAASANTSCLYMLFFLLLTNSYLSIYLDYCQ